jgi:hypothetical protein
MQAGTSLMQLQNAGVRSILLTSGTLSPMDSFAHELVRVACTGIEMHPSHILCYAASSIPHSPGELACDCRISGKTDSYHFYGLWQFALTLGFTF